VKLQPDTGNQKKTAFSFRLLVFKFPSKIRPKAGSKRLQTFISDYKRLTTDYGKTLPTPLHRRSFKCASKTDELCRYPVSANSRTMNVHET